MPLVQQTAALKDALVTLHPQSAAEQLTARFHAGTGTGSGRGGESAENRPTFARPLGTECGRAKRHRPTKESALFSQTIGADVIGKGDRRRVGEVPGRNMAAAGPSFGCLLGSGVVPRAV